MIARRAAQELHDGDFVNLGIGIPTLVADYLPTGINVTFQSENGVAGIGPLGAAEIDPYMVNAGGQPAAMMPGGAIFDSTMSFVLIRGGHLDVTILGALEVDQAGNLASWMVPGKFIPGMGGAMDLVNGAKRVIIAMEHTSKEGAPKILKQCTLPLTARKVVDLIVTNYCVFALLPQGLVLKELAPGVGLATVRESTAADFTVDPGIKFMPVSVLAID